MKKTIFVLEENEINWHRLKSDEDLLIWLKEGSISPGDLIVYPDKILTAKYKLDLKEI